MDDDSKQHENPAATGARASGAGGSSEKEQTAGSGAETTTPEQQIAALQEEKRLLEEKLDIASHDLVLSQKRMAHQLEELALYADVAKSLTGVIELEDLLGLCAGLIADRVQCRTGTIALYEHKENAVGLMVRVRSDTDDPPALSWLRTPISGGVMCRAAQTGKAIHIEDVEQNSLMEQQERELWRDGMLLMVPIALQNYSIAVAVLHRGTHDEDFSAKDLKRLTELAHVMGPPIHAAKLHHHQRCRIYASLESIADVVEIEPYMKGHSRRVQAYAIAVGEGLDFHQSRIGALQIASMLHDIGRIVIPESAVTHPGRLDERQREAVRSHPEAGAGFLKPLGFFGNVGEIILTHHESWDGTGYPDRKAGEEIPPVARVIAVADAFDAMTSPRPYRKAMSIGEALGQIQHLAGQQFDPKAVEAFMETPLHVLGEICNSNR